jgi:hypothetical protein
MQFLGVAFAWLHLFCLWNMPQPACDVAQALNPKSSRQQSPREDDEYSGPSHHLSLEKMD